jgi:hypothetical protein
MHTSGANYDVFSDCNSRPSKWKFRNYFQMCTGKSLVFLQPGVVKASSYLISIIQFDNPDEGYSERSLD